MARKVSPPSNSFNPEGLLGTEGAVASDACFAAAAIVTELFVQAGKRRPRGCDHRGKLHRGRRRQTFARAHINRPEA